MSLTRLSKVQRSSIQTQSLKHTWEKGRELMVEVSICGGMARTAKPTAMENSKRRSQRASVRRWEVLRICSIRLTIQLTRGMYFFANQRSASLATVAIPLDVNWIDEGALELPKIDCIILVAMMRCWQKPSYEKKQAGMHFYSFSSLEKTGFHCFACF